MAEEREYYSKKKLIYVVQGEGWSSMWGFGNLKAVERWFAAGVLFLAYRDLDYQKLVAAIRKHGKYELHHAGAKWTVRAVQMVGQKVKSSKRIKVSDSHS